GLRRRAFQALRAAARDQPRERTAGEGGTAAGGRGSGAVAASAARFVSGATTPIAAGRVSRVSATGSSTADIDTTHAGAICGGAPRRHARGANRPGAMGDSGYKDVESDRRRPK